jgi:DNA-binding MarR family transcriptional regulator
MGEILKNRLKMSKFESPMQEALLALIVAASELRTKMDRILGAFGITGEQYNILRILKGAGEEGHPCGEIGNRMMDRSPDVTRRIDTLEKQGFVERTRSIGDRRVVNVKITTKGTSLLDSISPELHAFEKAVSNNLSEAQLHELATLCENLIEFPNCPPQS